MSRRNYGIMFGVPNNIVHALCFLCLGTCAKSNISGRHQKSPKGGFMNYNNACLIRRVLAPSVATTLLVFAAGFSSAQQPTAAPAPQAQPAQTPLTPPPPPPPPSWQQGRPDTMKDSTLAPNP